jgi:glycosyltransferase involved in cell wall biosynthesis
MQLRPPGPRRRFPAPESERATLRQCDVDQPTMTSIIIPAHNERSVIARALTELLSNAHPQEMHVTVVCNGCTDDTANIARRFGPVVRVIESEIASKSHALNLGDEGSQDFPRIYTDADIVITANDIRALASRLEKGDVLAVAPTPHINLTDCSWLVRRYYDIRSRLPSSREGIGGSGVYALSRAGRERFAEFPHVIADDIFVRLQFKPHERKTLADVTSTVFAPRTIPQLVVVRTRAYLGVFELAHRFPELLTNREEKNDRVLIRLIKEPRLWLGLLIYCYVNTLARCRAAIRSRTGTFVWHRDDTSRMALSTDSTK